MKIYNCFDASDQNLRPQECRNPCCAPNCRPLCPTSPPCASPCARPPCAPPCPKPSPPSCLPICVKPCQNQDGYWGQGDQNQNLGDQSQSQGDQSQSQGDLAETLGDQSQSQGDLAETLGDQSQSQGDLAETLGDQSQSQGDLAETLGDQSQSQGDQSQAQGDLAETLGDQSQSQGDLAETLGDQSQSQGGQQQGDQTQSVTGHGGQEQGDQSQMMTGHGGQTLGDQTLSSSPTVSAPVNVSGVHVNVTVSCDGCQKRCHRDAADCAAECRRTIAALLSRVKALSRDAIAPCAAQAGVYACGLQELPETGSIGRVSDCTFTVASVPGRERMTVLTDALEALVFEPVAAEPNLFALLLADLQASPETVRNPPDFADCCYDALQRQLQAYDDAKRLLQINLSKASFAGIIYAIQGGIVYLADDLAEPAVIYAIPLCKILSYEPQ